MISRIVLLCFKKNKNHSKHGGLYSLQLQYQSKLRLRQDQYKTKITRPWQYQDKFETWLRQDRDSWCFEFVERHFIDFSWESTCSAESLFLCDVYRYILIFIQILLSIWYCYQFDPTTKRSHSRASAVL